MCAQEFRLFLRIDERSRAFFALLYFLNRLKSMTFSFKSYCMILVNLQYFIKTFNCIFEPAFANTDFGFSEATSYIFIS